MRVWSGLRNSSPRRAARRRAIIAGLVGSSDLRAFRQSARVSARGAAVSRDPASISSKPSSRRPRTAAIAGPMLDTLLRSGGRPRQTGASGILCLGRSERRRPSSPRFFFLAGSRSPASATTRPSPDRSTTRAQPPLQSEGHLRCRATRSSSATRAYLLLATRRRFAAAPREIETVVDRVQLGPRLTARASNSS